ncbi:MAG: response regulator [Clostridia bacterium]|nr:response regulator [Clostridia bacterium]
MYKLFLVEDEEKTRKGLVNYFISSYNEIIEVIGEAGDGRSALENILKLKPDVVITDIKMPVMDGIEMAKKIYEMEPQIKIIFISGYNDIDYLKSALSIDAIDYVFKPIDFNELDNVVARALDIVRSENALKENLRDMDQKLKKSMPLLKDKFFVNLIRGAYTGEGKIFEQIDFLGLNMSRDSQYCVMVAEIDDFINWNSQKTERERMAFFYGLLNVFNEIISNHMRGFAFENEQGEFVALLELIDDDDSDRIYSVAEKFKNSMYSYLYCEVSIGIGRNVNSLTAVAESYQTAKRALKSKLFLGSSSIIAIDGTEELQNNNTVIWEYEFSDAEAVFLNGSEEDIISCLQEIRDAMKKKHCTKITCQMNFIYLITRIQKIADRMGISEEADMKPDSVIECLCNVDTIDAMYKITLDFASAVTRIIAKLRKKKSTNAIENAKKIIEEHYADNITIESIADMVYLTSAYLCVLFKQETGYTITDYRTMIRMEKAKELLKDLKNKIYDISYAVGYENPSYFSLQFKKLTGMLPKEYRDTLRFE